MSQDSNSYTVIKDKDGLLKDFSFMPINQYGSLMITKSLIQPAKRLTISTPSVTIPQE